MLLKVLQVQPGGKRIEKQLILNAIRNNDFNRVEQTYFSLLQEKSTYSDRKRTIDSLRYIDNNFDEISFDDDNLCSAEGHVSHVLSARMSSRPMGWRSPELHESPTYERLCTMAATLQV